MVEFVSPGGGGGRRTVVGEEEEKEEEEEDYDYGYGEVNENDRNVQIYLVFQYYFTTCIVINAKERVSRRFFYICSCKKSQWYQKNNLQTKNAKENIFQEL